MASDPKSPGWFSRLVKSPGSKAPDDAQASHNRRREQVRRAQRTHRERKEKYVRSLEVEVAKLREQDSLHGKEIESYRLKIRHLIGLLNSHGITVPANLLLAQTQSPQVNIEVINYSDGTQDIRAKMPTFSSYSQSPSSPENMMQTTMSSGSDNTTPFSGQSNSNVYASISTPSYGSALSPGQNQSHHSPQNVQFTHPSGLDHPQVAVDFVLALERPCLLHHPAEPFEEGETATGHTLMLQSPIMARVPTATGPGGPSQPKYPIQTTWNVPSLEIEKLFSLSTNLSLEGEITPIEAWNRISKHPNFGQMDKNQLDVLKTALVAEVQCYGFGAVLDEKYFDLLLQQAYSQFSP